MQENMDRWSLSAIALSLACSALLATPLARAQSSASDAAPARDSGATAATGRAGAGSSGGATGFSGVHRPPDSQRSQADVRIGPPAVEPGLDPTIVRGLLNARRALFRRCYMVALAAEPALSGTAALTLVVGPDGRVMSVTPRNASTPSLGTVVTCLRAALATMTFPRVSGARRATVVVPFAFVPPRDGRPGER